MTRNPRQQADKGNVWTPLEESLSKDILKAEVRAWCERIGVDLRELHIYPMTRKWGSCSTSGRMKLNSDLLRQAAEFRKEGAGEGVFGGLDVLN